MSTELSKTYDPAAVESEAYRVWMEEKCFHADPAKPGEAYTIVIPPPNVTGALHLGHALNNTLQDILIRNHRMRGFNTLWMPGIDHAGIATQAMVEKQLKEKENKTRHDVGREGLVERIWAWKEQFGNRIIEQLKRLGCSCDWDRTRFTLDETCAKAVRETFFKLFKNGLIYRGKRLVNWDVHLQTSISDDEIYHETVKTSLWHIRYPIVSENVQASDAAPGSSIDVPRDTGLRSVRDNTAVEAPQSSGVQARQHGSETRAMGISTYAPTARPAFMTIATTRPETLLGDTAVAVHSDDPRWNWAIGKFVELPLTGRRIPIIADDILVDPKFGTGVVKVTPAHDPNDYAVWQRHQGKPDQIELLNILNPDGTIHTNGGKYAGMKRDAARKKVVEDLTAQGLLEKEEPHEAQVGHSDRSKTAVEPYMSDQWFVKMAPLAEPALEVVHEGKIKFHPERHAQQYLAWLGEKRDWPISRQLWWGHRIPVWRGETKYDVNAPDACTEAHMNAFEKGCTAAVYSLAQSYGVAAKVEVSFTRIKFFGPNQVNICVLDTAGEQPLHDYMKYRATYALEEAPTSIPQLVKSFSFPSKGSRTAAEDVDKYIRVLHGQDPDVLDTWFSSALWPHSTLGWPDKTPELAKYYPTSVLLTGRDIITLWVARMVMTGIYNMGDIPFRDVAINPTILDGKGERMSKTKGNGVDPVEIIDTHGADALRFTLATMATETQDVRLPVKRNAEGRNTSDKFEAGRNFVNKLWNAARFVLGSLEGVSANESQRNETGAPGDTGLRPMREDTAIDESQSFGIQRNPHGSETRVTGGSTGAPSTAAASSQSPALGPQSSPQPSSESSWSMAERWIVSRFNRTVEAANTALATYRFDIYAKVCYDFFWGDFCDWYVETAKISLKDPIKASQAANVLAAVLDGALRLMHPIIPFVTETLWWRLNEVRPVRGLPGRIDCPPSRRLIFAAWPAVGSFAEAAEFIFPRIQEIVVAIRNARNDYKADPRKNVIVSILAPGDSARQINDNRGAIELLASCTLKDVRADLTAIANAARITAAGCELFVEGLVDENAERERAIKQRDELTRKITVMEARVNNPGYLAKAPPHLVEQTKAELAEAKAELAKLKQRNDAV